MFAALDIRKSSESELLLFLWDTPVLLWGHEVFPHNQATWLDFSFQFWGFTFMACDSEPCCSYCANM